MSAVRRERTRDDWWFIGAVAVGAFIRFSTLGHQSFWSDEAATWAIMHMSFGSLLAAVRASESTPPLYYFLAWPWSHVFGFGEVGLRSLSAVFGTLTVVAVGLVARQLAGRFAGAAAAWIAATMPLLVWYSQEARSYSLLTLVSVLSVWAMLTLRSRPTVAAAATWTVVGVAALATHYFAAFLVAAELGVLIVWPGPLLKRSTLIGPTLILAIAAVPVALLAHDQYPNTTFVRSQPLGSSVVRAGGQLWVGYGVDPIMVLSAVLIVVGLALCVWPLIRDRRAADARTSSILIALTVSVALPVLVALAGAQLIYPRNVLYVLPIVALLAGAGAARTGRLWGAAVPVFAGLAVVIHIYFDPELQRTNTRGVAAAIGPALHARAILLTPPGSRGMWPYFPGIGDFPAQSEKIDSIALVGMSTSGGLNRNVAPLASLSYVPPPGFHQVLASKTSTFSLRVFKAARALSVAPGDLTRSAGGANFEPLLQPKER